MDPLTVALSVIAIASFLVFLMTRRDPYRGKRLPPGPKGLPIIGSALSIPERDYFKYEEFKNEYGELVFLRIGTLDTLLLNSARAMREALIDQADKFTVRWHSEYVDTLFLGAGIVFSDGKVWQDHRRFNLKVMRDFGAGKNVSEHAILVETDALRERLVLDQAVDMAPLFTDAVNNVMGQLTFGERTGTEDPQFAQLQEVFNSNNQDRSFIAMIPIMLPFTMKIPFFLTIFEYFVGFKKGMTFSHNYITSKFREHAKVLSSAGNIDEQEPHDICDALLIEQARMEKDPSSAPHTFHDEQIMRDVEDLFLAGTDTTSMTLTWAMFLLGIHQDVQHKVQEEIDSVIGRERRPSMKDRVQMPYVAAVVEEILRFSTIVPTGVAHSCAEDTQLMGYFIPKDIMVITNIYAIHRDPEVWENPNDFYPEHFLTKEGKFKPSDHLVPFSMGRRACLGEGLARMEIFLFFISIFQHLNVKLADPNLDVEKVILGMGGGTRRLLPHEVVFTAR